MLASDWEKRRKREKVNIVGVVITPRTPNACHAPRRWYHNNNNAFVVEPHGNIFSHRAAAAELIYCQESLSAFLLPQHMPVCMSALVGSPQFLKRTLTTTLAEMV